MREHALRLSTAGARRTVRNKRALQRIFGDQTRPKFLAIVPKARARGAPCGRAALAAPACAGGAKEHAHVAPVARGAGGQNRTPLKPYTSARQRARSQGNVRDEQQQPGCKCAHPADGQQGGVPARWQGHQAESKLKDEMTAAAGDASSKGKLGFLWVDPATAPQVHPRAPTPDHGAPQRLPVLRGCTSMMCSRQCRRALVTYVRKAGKQGPLGARPGRHSARSAAHARCQRRGAAGGSHGVAAWCEASWVHPRLRPA